MRRNVIAEVLADDSGAGAIEYGMVVSLVSMAAMLSLTSAGEAMVAAFGHVTGVLNSIAS